MKSSWIPVMKRKEVELIYLSSDAPNSRAQNPWTGAEEHSDIHHHARGSSRKPVVGYDWFSSLFLLLCSRARAVNRKTCLISVLPVGKLFAPYLGHSTLLEQRTPITQTGEMGALVLLLSWKLKTIFCDNKLLLFFEFEPTPSLPHDANFHSNTTPKTVEMNRYRSSTIVWGWINTNFAIQKGRADAELHKSNICLNNIFKSDLWQIRNFAETNDEGIAQLDFVRSFWFWYKIRCINKELNSIWI